MPACADMVSITAERVVLPIIAQVSDSVWRHAGTDSGAGSVSTDGVHGSQAVSRRLQPATRHGSGLWSLK